MRSELEQLQQIDQYLSGKMTADQSSAFEAQMNADPGLKAMVKDQQLLIQTVSRKAMMAEINAVAGLTAGAGASAAAGGWGATQWVITALSVIGVGVGSVLVYDAVTDETETINEPPTELTVNSNENVLPAFDTTEAFKFEMLDDEQDLVENENEETEDQDSETNNLQNKGSKTTNENDPLIDFSQIDKPHNNGYQHTAEVDETVTTSPIQKNRQASFPGGRLKMEKWFVKNMMYPGTAKKERVQGTVKVRFYVNITGEIDIISSDCMALLDENGHLLSGLKRAKYRKCVKLFESNAERAFRICPEWDPATNTSGTPIVSEQEWFVKFVLDGKSEIYTFGTDSGYIDEDDEGSIYDGDESDVRIEINTVDGIFIDSE